MNRIEVNPEICNGRPLLRGTRITVDTILSYLSAGDTITEIMLTHPQLSNEDVVACIEYARSLAATHTTVLRAS